jgi:hypothetical protein
MAFDPHANLAVSAIATAPSPPTTGTTLTVSAGEGARFPAAPFNATVWPATAGPTPANAEILRVTARTTDTLTVLRAQEGTTARAIGFGDQIAATITAKTVTDVETAMAQLNAANTFTQDQTISKDYPRLGFFNTLSPANSRLMKIASSTDGSLSFFALDDPSTTIQATSLKVSRVGDIYVERDVYEKLRTTPMGHWIDVPYAAGNFTAGGGMTWTVTAGQITFNRYTLIGKTLIWLVYIAGASLSGTSGAPLYVTMPPGCVGVYQRGVTPTTQLFDGAYARGWARVHTNGTSVVIDKDPPGLFTLNTNSTFVQFTIALEIN